MNVILDKPTIRDWQTVGVCHFDNPPSAAHSFLLALCLNATTGGGLGSIPVETGHVGSILDRDDGNIVLVWQRELQSQWLEAKHWLIDHNRFRLQIFLGIKMLRMILFTIRVFLLDTAEKIP